MAKSVEWQDYACMPIYLVVCTCIAICDLAWENMASMHIKFDHFFGFEIS